MKREILAPALAWAAGAVGFALRRWELSAALDPETLLFSPHPSTALLLGVTGAAVLVLALACRGAGGSMEPRERFRAPVTGYILLMVCAALSMLGAAGAGAVQFARELLLTGADWPLAVLCGLCLAGGVCVLCAGRAVYRRQWEKNTPVLFLVPAFTLLMWLVVGFQGHSKQPELLLCLFPLLAETAALLAAYGLSSLSLGRRGSWCCPVAAAGIPLSLTALADGGELCFALLHLSAALYLTAQTYLLLRAASGVPWPERMPGGAEEDEDGLTTQETDAGPEPAQH